MQTNIVKWGNSQGIRLPKILLESAGLSEIDIVDITVENGNIIIKKAENKNKFKTIQERFEGFDGEYEPTEIDWGTPKGEELW
ncbi:AbrB/MazE/SpoVT family DNA-binding domain-containing protein [Sedimentibacter sp.]|uniref:AbrB/MazE/SpoVT family DNA-binding domain-containing protein n=1 Tax=Sedimentibacter sp. TaxID=1960295 RepID=UPI00289BFCDA|nr:AbrB/MazE/SpoVT family DNA-binding domain-containing protein [Sedimentibacter sp.]